MKLTNIESKIVWDEFLNYVEEEFLGYIPIIARDSGYTAVIIEPREHEDLLLSIRSTMYYLNETDSKIKWGFILRYLAFRLLSKSSSIKSI